MMQFFVRLWGEAGGRSGGGGGGRLFELNNLRLKALGAMVHNYILYNSTDGQYM